MSARAKRISPELMKDIIDGVRGVKPMVLDSGVKITPGKPLKPKDPNKPKDWTPDEAFRIFVLDELENLLGYAGISVDDEPLLSLHSEYLFMTERQFRFDFAFPKLKIAVELNGGVYGNRKGGHSSSVGIRRDYKKMNCATACGYRVFQLTKEDCMGEGAKQVVRLLGYMILKELSNVYKARFMKLSDRLKTSPGVIADDAKTVPGSETPSESNAADSDRKGHRRSSSTKMG